MLDGEFWYLISDAKQYRGTKSEKHAIHEHDTKFSGWWGFPILSLLSIYPLEKRLPYMSSNNLENTSIVPEEGILMAGDKRSSPL